MFEFYASINCGVLREIETRGTQQKAQSEVSPRSDVLHNLIRRGEEEANTWI
jgi:hypothetical protein